MEILTYSDYRGYKEQLDRAINETTQNFVVIGYLLMQARDTDVLTTSGYTSMGEFARHEYGLDESVTSRFINIAERYGDGNGRLKAEYSAFTYSKLGEMLTLPSEVVSIVTPDMTVKDIREIKDQVQEEEHISDVEVMIEAAGQGEPDTLADFMKNYLEDRPEEFKALAQTEDIAKAYDILAPQGRVTLIARVTGVGKIMISIESMDEVKAVYIRENRSETLTFKDIDDALSRLFERVPYPDTEDLNEVYRQMYGHEIQKETVQPPKPEKIKATKTKTAPKQKKSVQKEPENVQKAPENVQKAPENFMPEPQSDDSGEIATPQDTKVPTLYHDTLMLIDKLRGAFENRKWEQALDGLDPIKWKIQTILNMDQALVDNALDALMED